MHVLRGFWVFAWKACSPTPAETTTNMRRAQRATNNQTMLFAVVRHSRKNKAIIGTATITRINIGSPNKQRTKDGCACHWRDWVFVVVKIVRSRQKLRRISGNSVEGGFRIINNAMYFSELSNSNYLRAR